MKKNLRSQINLAEAKARDTKMQKLMTASSNDKETFYKMIRRQRASKSADTTELIMEEVTLAGNEQICEGWAKHFGKLATPQNLEEFDQDYCNEVALDVKLIEDHLQDNGDAPIQVSNEQVSKAIRSLNTGKAPDADGITIEHIKNAGILMTAAIAQIINAILVNKKIPERLKLGIVTPIWKKNDKKQPSNYRGITVISTVGKILEVILRDEMIPILKDSQNRFQKGFTRGTSPLNAALIMHEAILDASITKTTRYIAMLDATKAFDVVSHKSLLRKLYDDGIKGPLWSMVADTFVDAKSLVKWHDARSNTFQIAQGVRQGGLLSTEQYKRYNNDLLNRLEESPYGARVGNIKCTAPTCADDIALIADSRTDLQALLDLCYSYIQYERFQLHPKKSMILVYNSKVPHIVLQEEPIFMLGKDTIPIVEEATHLGIIRDLHSAGKYSTIRNNTGKARKALYALMGTGMHGTNGLTPAAICIHMLQIYVMPILLYGLEILLPSERELQEAIKLHENTLRQLLSLPTSSAKPAMYILSGQIPLTGQIHRKALTFFGSILRNEQSIEQELAERQIVMKSSKANSWFSEVKKILIRYNLPTALTLLQNPVVFF